MKLFYRQYGSGQPLIILHGLFGQSDNWNTLAKQFASAGFEVFAVDLRNHGLSPHSDDWNYSLMAADIVELMDDNKLNDVILMGHSMGGKVAMQVALDHPAKLNKLIVVDIAPKEYPPHYDRVLEGLNAINFKFIKSRKEAEVKLSNYVSDEATKQFLLKNIYWKDDETLDWRFNLKVINANYKLIGKSFETKQSTSDVPAWFIRGEKSDYVLPSDEKNIRQIFKNVSLLTIPGSGHWIHAEQPKLFFEAVIEIIST